MAFLSDRTTRTHTAWRKETQQEGRNWTLRFSYLSTGEKKLVSDMPGRQGLAKMSAISEVGSSCPPLLERFMGTMPLSYFSATRTRAVRLSRLPPARLFNSCRFVPAYELPSWTRGPGRYIRSSVGSLGRGSRHGVLTSLQTDG
jgi:hypothetical protein